MTTAQKATKREARRIVGGAEQSTREPKPPCKFTAPGAGAKAALTRFPSAFGDATLVDADHPLLRKVGIWEWVEHLATYDN